MIENNQLTQFIRLGEDSTLELKDVSPTSSDVNAFG